MSGILLRLENHDGRAELGPRKARFAPRAVECWRPSGEGTWNGAYAIGKEGHDEQNELCRSLRNENAFGWQTQMLGEEMGNYVLATTTETDESGPKKPGAINGGFFPKRPDWPAQHPSLVIAVDDIRVAMRQVTGAGGKVLGEPMGIPGVGQYVAFFDPEGNRVSMLQPVPRSWHAPKAE
jgi:hypothetical protein